MFTSLESSLNHPPMLLCCLKYIMDRATPQGVNRSHPSSGHLHRGRMKRSCANSEDAVILSPNIKSSEALDRKSQH